MKNAFWILRRSEDSCYCPLDVNFNHKIFLDKVYGSSSEWIVAYYIDENFKYEYKEVFSTNNLSEARRKALSLVKEYVNNKAIYWNSIAKLF